MAIYFDKDHGVGGTGSYASHLKKAEKELLKNYKKSLNKILTQLQDIYSRYSVEGVLTYTEMMKFNRLNKLFNAITKEIDALVQTNNRLTAKTAKSVLVERYKLITGEIKAAIEKGVGRVIDLDFGVLNSEAVLSSVQNPLYKLAIEDLKKSVLIQVRREITQGLITGDNYFTVSQNIKKRLDVSASRALTITRTETGKAFSDGHVKAHDRAAEYGVIANKVWVAALDDRTRDTHQSMDQQVADKDGYFKYPGGGKTQAPRLSGPAAEVVNCRCRFITVVKGYEPKSRIAQAVGKSEKVKYQTYKDWEKSKN